ncbi:ABC transporter ATP-binding protein [Paenibacillus abyssi]|uniref:ABC transporter ATP-binding protein n=1 Tax=Paenibacillus abyssi TaxID=1340531 RepID=A0A917D3X1_9BACL|nr:ABC transporter ATP-binding protein [Paenibacillus abyssi]GGG09997.1 ABC transporter ATP-binding protein [Paenibacillus abyssi]
MNSGQAMVLQVDRLRKSFGSVVAVDGISFDVAQGEVFTIIGPNGAGKTTTLEMIEGMQKPDDGTITILGDSWSSRARSIKMRIGVQPQSSALFDLLTVEENLDVFASFYERQRPVEEIMRLINLTDHRDKRVKTLSGGQKQRLAIGLAMVNDPEIIFLDEPTTGLDPQARRNIWDIVLKLKELGKTTILTTHYMEEAEKLSDRVCIVDQGKIIAIDTPKALIGRLTKEREIHLTFTGGAAQAAEAEGIARTTEAVTSVSRDGEHLIVCSTRPEQTLYRLFGYTTEQEVQVEQVSIREMSLEDVFIAFTGKEWRD